MSNTGRIFEFGGGREAVVTAEKAETLLSAIVVKDPSHIKLSNKSFSSEAALCISKHLLTFKNIEIADISDIIAGRAEEDALLTLKTICDSILGDKLIELNVSDNALGSKGVTACKSLFTRKSLKRLYACNNGLSADACVLVAELLLESGCPELTTLHFYNNMSGDGGAAAIAGNQTVTSTFCPLFSHIFFLALTGMRIFIQTLCQISCFTDDSADIMLRFNA
jgi:Ran GTPase-activating protein 1